MPLGPEELRRRRAALADCAAEAEAAERELLAAKVAYECRLAAQEVRCSQETQDLRRRLADLLCRIDGFWGDALVAAAEAKGCPVSEYDRLWLPALDCILCERSELSRTRFVTRIKFLLNSNDIVCDSNLWVEREHNCAQGLLPGAAGEGGEIRCSGVSARVRPGDALGGRGERKRARGDAAPQTLLQFFGLGASPDPCEHEGFIHFVEEICDNPLALIELLEQAGRR
eukprot:TRINITY_DN20951_c0_g1_i1.p1 TRINITY_DN20951_c0_g1~~TRINITY_DN20951_c0_g1_i1.p1  ORF type:complete len:255 (+),score=111.40 TRINITY_DN20951_c0_g1_i1:83-766(+)